jgi:ferritin-like metal-binding protein YciE
MFGKIKSLRELFEIELGYAYDCEKKLVEKGLPSMIENAGSSELRSALEKHLQETRTHEPRDESNAVLSDLMSAAKDSVSHTEDNLLRDAALIVNGNFVEHYEIALYGSLAAFAKGLGLQDVAQLLTQTLTEEKAADAKLSEIGESLLGKQSGKRQAAGAV